MDLYRYFHPHHNPRLRSTPLRLQELGELEQAAIELKKAVKRAEIRASNSLQLDPGSNTAARVIHPCYFSEILSALEYLVESLAGLTDAHPGDAPETMRSLLQEREDAPGWENWTRLLRQRLALFGQYQDSLGGDTLEELKVPAAKAVNSK